ncbi:MAG: hypothetical protein IPL61_02205 [Myxococcales bacterium]|nr:hypothetical protein [Myxococcales bacterium]
MDTERRGRADRRGTSTAISTRMRIAWSVVSVLVGVGVGVGACADRRMAVEDCRATEVTPVALAPGAAASVTLRLGCSEIYSAGSFGLAAARDGAPTGPVYPMSARELPGLTLRFELPADALTATAGAAVVVVDDDDDEGAWYPVADVSWSLAVAP